MENKFIYVFTKEDRDALLFRGCTLLTDNESSDIYVLTINDKEEMNFSVIGNYVLSDTLTF